MAAIQKTSNQLIFTVVPSSRKEVSKSFKDSKTPCKQE